MVSAQALETTMVCPACRGRLHRPLGSKDDYAMSQCSTCRVIFLNVRAGNDAIAELYDHYYERARFELPAVAAASLERLAGSFERFRKTNRWLDVGYGEGGLLGIAHHHGWDCYGTEVSPQALDYGQGRGWTVTKVEDDPRFPEAGFDVMTMIEFLEHVPSPDQFLLTAARWLRPGGLLYITTPNVNSLNRRALGLNWSIFSPPEHVTIWSAHGLRHALGKAGFEVRRVRTEGFNPSEILGRLRARNDARKPVDRNTAAFALNGAFSSSRFRRAVKSGINSGLSVFQAGDTLKVWAVRS